MASRPGALGFLAPDLLIAYESYDFIATMLPYESSGVDDAASHVHCLPSCERARTVLWFGVPCIYFYAGCDFTFLKNLQQESTVRDETLKFLY